MVSRLTVAGKVADGVNTLSAVSVAISLLAALSFTFMSVAAIEDSSDLPLKPISILSVVSFVNAVIFLASSEISSKINKRLDNQRGGRAYFAMTSYRQDLESKTTERELDAAI